MIAIDRRRALAALVMTATLGVAGESAAQQPISFDSLAAIAAPAPTQRIAYAPAAGHFDVVAPTTSTWPIVMNALRDLVGQLGR